MNGRVRQQLTYWIEEADERDIAVHFCHPESERPLFSMKGGVIDLAKLASFMEEQLHAREAAQ